MQSLILSLFLLFAAASASTKRFDAFAPSLFGISRGGGLFGSEKKGATAVTEAPKTLYPAMSNEEVEEWLSHIPVFAVTDENGAGVVLKPDNDTNVFYFFMSPVMANATLNQLKGTNSDLNLRISAFSLGKIWFNILKSNREIKLKAPGSEEEIELGSNNVEYRLVPDTRDLLGARMLLTMDGSEGEALKKGEQLSPEMAQNAIKKAMTEAPKFNTTFNEIPVFMIQQMRIQKQGKEGDTEEPTTLIPMYFNLQNMVQIWQQFTAQSEDTKGVEPAINLMDLFELVEKMQEESEIDFRNVLLVPSVGGEGQGSPGAVGAATAPTSPQGDEFQMPGAGTTLGDV